MRSDFAGRPDLPAALDIGEHVRVAVEQIPVEDGVDLGSGPLSTGKELELPPQLVSCESPEPLLSEHTSALCGDPAACTELGRSRGLHPSAEQRLAVHAETIID